MQCFIFDLQRFAQVAIEAGKSVTIDGVTYSAVSDSVLNLDDGEKVSGIASGSVTATLEGNSAVQITFDGKKSFEFSCAAEDDALAVVIQGKSIKFTSGTINCSTDGFSASGEVSVTGFIANALPFDLKLDIADAGINITPGNETTITAPEKVDATLTFPENVAKFIETFKPLIALLLNVDEDTANKIYDVLYKLVSSPTTAQLEGTFSWNQDEKKLVINKDSNLALNILDYNLSMTAKEGNVDGMNFFAQFSEDDAAVGMKFTPSTDANASLDLKLYKNDSQICDGLINVAAGSIDIDILNGKTSVEKNTVVTFTQGDDKFQFKFDKAATLTYAADEEGISQFTFGNNDGKVDIKLYRDDKEILTANVEINGTITVDTRDYSIGVTKNTTATIKINDHIYTLTATDDAGATVAFQDDKFVLTPKDGNGGIIIAITKDNATVFGGTLNVTGGTITFDPIEQKFSFTKGTKISFALGDGSQEIDFEVKGSDASFKIEPDKSGSFTITPDTEDGSVDVTLKQNNKTVFENNLSVNGSIIFNPTTQLLTLKNGTTVSVTFNNYTLTATADGDASSTISMTTGGILITPDTTDKGKLKLTLTGTSSGSLSADIEILSGSLLFGLDGNLTVTKDTELEIKFSDDYIINFKATGDAGGVLSLGTDGITFKPSSDEKDGGLKLTVTRGKDTRSASLDVTGSVTYKLDGSISLAKGTVVKNVFDDGNILTITANTDAGGTINFNPQTGLTITPSKPKALTVSLQTGDLEVVKITSIDGSINYSGGIVTASNGTKARISYYFGWKSDLYTKGGTASLQFTADRTVYTANEGATFAVDYLDGTTLEIENGTYSDIYATETSKEIELISAGSTFRSNDNEVVFTLETAGDYNLNGVDVTTSEDNTQVVIAGDYNIVQFAADAGITVSATEDKSFRFGVSDDGTITVTTTDSGDFGVSSGSITFDDGKISIAAGTTISFTTGEQFMTFTAPAEISMPVKMEEDVYYLTIDEATLNLSVTQSEQKVFSGDLEIDGVFSWRPSTGTFGLTGANSSHGNDSNTSLQLTTDSGLGIKLATNDTTVVFVPKFADGKLNFNFPNERKDEMLFTLSRNGKTIFENQVTIAGTVSFDVDAQEISLTKGTVLTLTQGDNAIEITALADAGGKLTFVDNGIKFAPNTGDGQLELNFVSANRKANIDVTGAIILGEGGKISLEKGTEVNFTWDDGAQLKLTSKGSTGSIGLDEKGIKITSEDENLTIDLTLATGDQTHLSGIKGTIYYNAGTVSFDENSTITATTTLGGESILMTLETIGGTGHLDFASNGVIYSADTGAMRITWKNEDDLESTFTVNSGSVQIGHGLFQISEGTDLATDLKDFVPALYFTTSEAGTYTINKQTIETTAENISMTATDYYMTFKTSDDPVKYDGMNFAGAGNVSLTTDGVVLGAGVVADGFGIDKSFILAEAGNVTADARIFELTEDVPTGLTVTGAQDGFIFSRVNTEESEFRFDDPDLSNVGKIFTEQFFLTNDDSYRIQSDLLGLQKIIGVSAPSTLHAAASFGEDDSYSVFDIVTDSEGTFNIGEKDYSISGDDEVAVKSRFFDGLASVTAVNDLNGTISGDFTAHEVSINGSASAVQVFGDENISIAADDNGFEISGLDTNASLKVAATDTYIVNNTTINANGGDYIMGLDNGAALYGVNNDTIITGTEGNDTIQNIGTNVTIQALGGDDSISNSGDNASIDAGAGSNQIKLSGSDEVIVLKGQTSVEGFNTGFGDGSDTIYIHTENDPAGVEFLDDGLTFGNDTASLTLSDVNTTAKVNLFHENRDMLNKGVFIAPGDWYSVEDSDLTVDAGEEVYFVGTAVTPKAGVDFSGITGDLNLTLDTAYIDTEEYVEGTTTWINGVYSLKGGAGNTTITGSKLDDTIISGAGDTTINAAKGDDLISLSGSAALITYEEGDGNDTIVGFDEDATLSIGDNVYSTQVSGNDLIITVGESKITLLDAANETDPNIDSTNGLVQVVEAIEKRTAAGYPVIAGRVFNPEEITGPEPTNYAEKEDWTITSADGLELYGVHYTPENSNDKWVVLVHGYGCMYESMNPFATFYLANNYNVLMIDQRAAGKSEGTWLTMGVAESQDVALWTQEIANRYPDSKITLHGVSMGAATAILTAARQDAVNVTSIVEDCGYSDVMQTFETIVADHPELSVLGISSEIIPLIDPVAEGLTGYYLHDAAPIDSISSVKQPTLFISGDDDGVAPVSMLHELYDASGAEVKEKFIVQGAGHARSGLVDPVGYSNSVFRFISEANGEGWETSNRDDNISLRGTKYNDTLANSGENVTIDSGAGDDDISNIADNVAIFSGDGNDTIYNHADNITIDAGLGNNSISNNSDNVVFIWSGGDDTIDGFKEDSVLQIAATKYSTKKSGDDIIVTVGDDEIVLTGAASLDTVQIIDSNPTVISNSANDTLITGTGGDDSIENSGDNVTIKVYGGDDTINNTGANAIIDGSDGADSISNYSPTGSLIANGVSVNAGAGNDTIQNHHAYYVTLEGGSGDDHISVFIGNQTYVDGGSGNDTILGETVESDSSTWAMGGYATIDGGDGNDYIDPGFSDSASIMGGDGNDTIINEGDDATINGGAGNDVISLHGASLNNDVIKYDVGSGNDSIFGFNETSQLSITAGTEYETQISGDDVLVTVGEDVLTITGGENVLTIVGGASLSTINIVNYEVPALELSNTTNNTLITGTELADTIENTGTNVTISGRASNDSIISSGANGSMDGGAGNDTLENSGANATVEGYYGDDYLINSGDNVLIGGNYGNDIIENSGSNVTINPGSGDNIVINSGSNVLIEFTGGTDSVWGFNATSKLSVASGASSIRVDDDIIVTVGDDKIILVDAASVIPEGIVLTKKGTYTIDGKIFELTKNVPSGVTITSAQDGFTTAITNPDGKIFIDEFSAIGDDSYTAQIDGKGLQTVSGINTGTEITTSATLDGEEEENEIYIVTEDAGSYTFNDMDFTTSEDNAVIRLRPQAMAFDSSDGILYDGKTFTGSGFVTVTSSSYAIGAGVVADGFNSGESFILMQRGAATVDGKTFELTENVKQNMTVGVEDGGYTFSHEITQKEIVKNNVPSDYLGKIYSENVIVEGDETYSLRADSFGLKKVSGISNGATINGGDTSIDGNYNDKYAKSGQHFYVDTDTDTEGTFTFGEKTYNVSGDSNVEIKAMFLPEKSYASGFANLDGTVRGSFAGDEFYVNGNKKPILVEGDDDFYVVGGTSGTKLLDISDGASLVSLGGVKEVHTDTEGVFWLAAEPVPFGVTVTGDDNVTFGFNAAGDLMSADNLEGSIRFSKGTGGELSINGIGIHIKNTAFSSIGAYDDSLYIHDIERGTISAGEKVWLEMTGETMTLNGNELTLTGDDDGIWIRDKEIVGLDENASLQVSKGGTYLANETELKAKAGDVIIGLENDAYVYDEKNPLVTKNTSTEDLEKIFAPENTEEISSSKDITLEGGNLAIVEDTAAQVNITAGDDTIVSKGENVHVTLTPEKNTWLFPLEGKMTLEGYDETTGTGFGTMFTDIPSAVEDGRIDFNNGWLKLGSAQVDVGSNSALMNFFDRYGRQQKIGYASQGDSLDVSNSTDDLILVAKENSTLTGGLGNDTILADEGSLVDAGAGNNLIKSDGANVAFNGRTTVEGEVDTIYIANADPGVDFKSNGLTFYDNSVGKSLTFSGVTTTQKMNLHYAASGVTSSHVFIADDEWYDVSDGAADYYVGATAKKNHGIDFSGVSEALDVTLNTDYAADTTFWINNVHSIKGGSASTKITGSEFDDTIFAGTGETTINAGAGHDKIFGSTSANKNVATFYYMAGDGRDSIENFDFMSNAQDTAADKIQLDDNSAITEVLLRGSDVMIKVDGADGFLMIEDAKGKSFRLNDDLVAKVDTNVAFDGFTNSYVGIGTQATLTVGKGLGNVEVWLSDDSLEYHGKMYDGNFKVLDASQADGSNILAGNEQNNSIFGGAGNDSLWGGYNSENDTLIGGAGQNTFFYLQGNGRDVIQNAHDGDNIILDDITLDQIADANITAGGVAINFTDGGSLTINGTADVIYQLADGSKYSANHLTLEWNDK